MEGTLSILLLKPTKELTSSSHLTTDQAAALRKLFSEFCSAFAKDDDLGRTYVIKHSVKTGNVAQIRVQP
ncbi:hypothetical protein CHS0354_021267 [Potamilus streckersoni]|uniref:Uncharacterized protein n=1 Tax=Potamilus streckersoni TaxID=2493646 RepID=A0AAE0VH99_9BIVA|nr:hypothetical protein CHS0354_021267 [Potamilus streckersoni]